MKYLNLTREEAIKKARTLCARDDGSEGRKWLVGKAPDCYNNPNYSTEIHVLEGSPARGYVLDLGEFGGGVVVALNLNGKVLREFEYISAPKKLAA